MRQAAKIVLAIAQPGTQPIPAARSNCAIRGHFDHEREQVSGACASSDASDRSHWGVGLAVLVLFPVAGALAQRLPPGSLRNPSRRLVITGWVAIVAADRDSLFMGGLGAEEKAGLTPAVAEIAGSRRMRRLDRALAAMLRVERSEEAP